MHVRNARLLNHRCKTIAGVVPTIGFLILRLTHFVLLENRLLNHLVRAKKKNKQKKTHLSWDKSWGVPSRGLCVCLLDFFISNSSSKRMITFLSSGCQLVSLGATGEEHYPVEHPAHSVSRQTGSLLYAQNFPFLFLSHFLPYFYSFSVWYTCHFVF